eukprot:7459962-Alexandrium_andersonii.AAC.1
MGIGAAWSSVHGMWKPRSGSLLSPEQGPSIPPFRGREGVVVSPEPHTTVGISRRKHRAHR